MPKEPVTLLIRADLARLLERASAKEHTLKELSETLEQLVSKKLQTKKKKRAQSNALQPSSLPHRKMPRLNRRQRMAQEKLQELGLAIKEMRENAGLGHVDVACKLEWPPQSVAALEAGHRGMSMRYLEILAQALNLTAGEKDKLQTLLKELAVIPFDAHRKSTPIQTVPCTSESQLRTRRHSPTRESVAVPVEAEPHTSKLSSITDIINEVISELSGPPLIRQEKFANKQPASPLIPIQSSQSNQFSGEFKQHPADSKEVKRWIVAGEAGTRRDNQDFDFALGLCIKELRNESRLTRPALAKASLLTEQTIRDIERGKREISVNDMLAISKALNVVPSDIATRAESKRIGELPKLILQADPERNPLLSS